MDNRISHLVDRFTEEASKYSGLLDQKSSGFLTLVVNNSLEYDSDTIRKLLLASPQNEQECLDLRQKLHTVSSQISEDQFKALLSLKKENQNTQPEAVPGPILAPTTAKENIPQTSSSVAATSSFAPRELNSEGNDLAELRSRLLSRKTTTLQSSNMSLDNQNDMHQAKQDSLADELLGVIGQFRHNIARFNESLENESDIRKTATQNLEKVGGAATQIGKLLKVFNERGKIGFWFYVYVSVALVVVPLVMLAIIRLIPRGIF